MFQRCAGLAVGGAAYFYARSEQRRVEALAREIPTWIDSKEFANCGPRLKEIVDRHLSEVDQARVELQEASKAGWHGCYLQSWRNKKGLNALLPEVRARILLRAEGRPFPLRPILVGAAAMALSGSWLSGVGGGAIALGVLALRRFDCEGPSKLAQYLNENTTSDAPEAQPIIAARTEYERRVECINTLAQEIPQDCPSYRPDLNYRPDEKLRILRGLPEFEERAEQLSAESPNYPALIAEARSALLLRSYRAEREQQPIYRPILALLLGTLCLWRSL